MTDERMARMGLAASHDSGDAGLAKLVRESGAAEVWEYLRSGRGQSGLAARAAAVDLDRVARRTAAVGARFVIPGDDEWPPGVADLAWGEPVGGFGGEPFGLWVIGPADLGALGAGIAMVGSRAGTAYGEHVAQDLAAGVAEQGYPVISGGAYGIDSAAHRGAIAVSGRTVAVMAGGLAQLYPPGNEPLLKAVVEHGGVVSEFPPDTPPSRSRFLIRNRLIAALAAATVVVEAAVRSGAQNTVSWALSLSRPVLAVPGPVTSAMSVTPHRLIRNGEATLVTGVDDVLAAVRPLDPGIPDYNRAQPSLFDALTPEQKVIQEALPSRRSVSVDELAALTGQPVLPVMAALGQLERLGLVTRTPDGYWRVRPGLERVKADKR